MKELLPGNSVHTCVQVSEELTDVIASVPAGMVATDKEDIYIR